MSAIDGVQSVFGLVFLGLSGVVHGQEETTLEDAEGCNDVWDFFGFHQGWLRGGLGSHGHNAKFDSTGK